MIKCHFITFKIFPGGGRRTCSWWGARAAAPYPSLAPAILFNWRTTT